MELKHWTHEDLVRLQHTKDLHELADITIGVMDRMPKPIATVSGPISTGGLGSLEENLRFFDFAVKKLEESGITVIDFLPVQDAMMRITNHNPIEGKYDMDILEVFFHKVYTAGHISSAYFLPKWETSKGSSWERELFEKIDIECKDYPPELLKDFIKK